MAAPVIWSSGASQFLQAAIKIPGSTSGFLTMATTASTTSYTITFPGSQGAASTVLVNDGSGGLTWGTASNILSMATFGSSPNANGGTISGSTLTLQPADATNPGGVSTTTQTFAGAKTMTNPVLKLPSITDTSDPTKLIAFSFTGTTGKTITLTASQTNNNVLTFPDVTLDTLAGIAASQTFTNKSIDATSNTLTNIANASISASAAIARSKLAAGTANHVVINAADGTFSSEAQLAASRGGTGQNFSASTGAIQVSSGTFSAGTISIANGGTGQTTAASAFAALSPQTTKGDMIVYTSTTARLAVGTNSKSFVANSNATAGVGWQIMQESSSKQNVSVSEISGTPASNDITFYLVQFSGADPTTTSPSYVSMRSSSAADGSTNIRTFSATSSLVINSGTTLGLQASINQYVYLYAIDSDGSGTMKLGVSTIKLDEGSLQSTVAQKFTVTFTNATNKVNATAHGLLNNDRIRFQTTGAVPTGLTANTDYYVVSKTANDFQVAATINGAAIDFSTDGTGTNSCQIANYRLSSDAVYTGVPIRLLGRFLFNLTTPGTWTDASEFSTWNPSMDVNDTIVSRYTNCTSGALGTSTSTLVFSTRALSSVFIYDTTGGAFVAPQAGTYILSGQVECGAMSTSTAGEGITIQYRINAGTDASIDTWIMQATGITITTFNNFAIPVTLAANDFIELRGVRDTHISGGTPANNNANWVCLQRIGV